MWGQSARPGGLDAVVGKTALAHTSHTHTSQSSQTTPTNSKTHADPHSSLATRHHPAYSSHIPTHTITHTGSPVPTGCHQSLPSSHTHTSQRPASRHCPPTLLPLIHSHLTHTAQQPPSPHQPQRPLPSHTPACTSQPPSRLPPTHTSSQHTPATQYTHTLGYNHTHIHTQLCVCPCPYSHHKPNQLHTWTTRPHTPAPSIS